MCYDLSIWNVKSPNNLLTGGNIFKKYLFTMKISNFYRKPNRAIIEFKNFSKKLNTKF
jgi:hypothetical protein